MNLVEMRDSAVLCYVCGPWAYFTTRELGEQWGDDWNDAPYEHNAGRPYDDRHHDDDGLRRWQIFRVAYESWGATPDDWCGLNSPYSVEAINNGVIPWLRPDPFNQMGPTIVAGTTYRGFIWQIESTGGTVYVPHAVG